MHALDDALKLEIVQAVRRTFAVGGHPALGDVVAQSLWRFQLLKLRQKKSIKKSIDEKEKKKTKTKGLLICKQKPHRLVRIKRWAVGGQILERSLRAVHFSIISNLKALKRVVRRTLYFSKSSQNCGGCRSSLRCSSRTARS